jgi:hypothetical protein
LTDFNIAVHFSDRRLLTGVAGSLAYMGENLSKGTTYANTMLKTIVFDASCSLSLSSRSPHQKGLCSTGRLVVSRGVRVSRRYRYAQKSDDCLKYFASTRRYELLFGKRPFRGRTNSILTEAILREPLTWPSDASSRLSNDGMQVLRNVSGTTLIDVFLPSLR